MSFTPASDQIIVWVERNILPHEARLRKWLRSSFLVVDVDDVVQEAYCRIAALSCVDHITDPQNYFFKTARNIVLEQIRRSRTVHIETVSGLAELDALAPQDRLSPERVVAGRLSLKRVEQLIAALPERARRVVRLRKIDGLSQREVAGIMGISEHVVENDVARSLRRILAAMADDENGEEQDQRQARPIPRWRTSRDD
jgi:RNA polymerase sigma-70 factor (ECF subfamily)